MITSARLIDAIDARFGTTDAPRRIGVAVSGGSDSLALLHLLHEWGGADAIEVATVDHRLRPDSASEAATVASRAAQLGLPHRTLEWRDHVAGNLQDQARRARYALLADWGEERGLHTVCLGHTLDDVAETFLMRLGREAGVDGLAAMEDTFHRNGQRFDRPLLSHGRQELRAFLGEMGVEWIDDPSNDDTRFDRVRARATLATLEQSGLSAANIAASATNLRAAADALRAVAHDVAARIAKEDHGDIVFDRTALGRQPQEMSYRLIAAALAHIGGDGYPARRAPMLDAAMNIREKRTFTLHGCLVTVSDMTARFSREYNAVCDLTTQTDAVWDNRWTLTGPHSPRLRTRALGDGLTQCPNWRRTGLPRTSLVASPAIWDGDTLVAAPLAGLENGWNASATGRGPFAKILYSR